MMFIGILVSVFYIDVNIYLRIPIKLCVLPLVVGIGYEFIRYAGKHDNLFVRHLLCTGALDSASYHKRAGCERN